MSTPSNDWVPTSPGEKLLANAITKSNAESSPQAVIDPVTIIGIISAIMDFIKGCRNPDAASAHMARGSAIAEGHARKALRSANYQGDIRSAARSLVKQGVAATDAERATIINEASDVPAPPASTGPWAFLLFMALCLVGATASAAEPFDTSSNVGPWPQITADLAAIKTTAKETQAEIGQLSNSVADLNNRAEGIEESLAAIRALIEPKAPEPTLADPPPVASDADLKRQAIADMKKTMNSMSQTLKELSDSYAAKATARAPAAASGAVTFQGRPINVNAFLASHPARTVEIAGSVDNHLRAHGFAGDFSGLSRATKIRLHSAAHAMGVGATASPARTVAVSTWTQQSSNCANGNCSRAAAMTGGGYRIGLFGKLKPAKKR